MNYNSESIDFRRITMTYKALLREMAHQASTQTPYKGLFRLDNTLDTEHSTDSKTCQRGESVYCFVTG